MKYILLAIFSIAMVGCTALQIDSSISQYNKVASQIKLGDNKEDVLAVLEPTQKGLPTNSRKPSDSYLEGNDLIEIYYFRTGRQPDDLTTDDEFTPYTFKNGKLVGIGWVIHGGPKSRGQVIQPPAQINQTTVVY